MKNRQTSSSSNNKPWSSVILLLVCVVVYLPSFFTLAQAFLSSGIKLSLESVNLVLVVFAILVSLLNRLRSNNNHSNVSSPRTDLFASNNRHSLQFPSTPKLSSEDFHSVMQSMSSTDTEGSDSFNGEVDDVKEEETPIGVSCPSLDVNMEADRFIARIREDWRQ